MLKLNAQCYIAFPKTTGKETASDMPTMSSRPSRLFAYIIRTVDSQYGITGCVPWIEDGRVFLRPCKRLMRPEVLEGD
jgi:hypothetical protein